jgi:hypothetical protein
LGDHEENAFVDLVPTDWFRSPETSTVWLRAYRVMRVGQDSLPDGIRTIRLHRVVAVLVFGTLKYLDASSPAQIISETEWHLPSPVERETTRGCYLTLLTPYVVDGACGDEAATLNRLDAVSGLLASLNGKNMIYQHVFDNQVPVGGNGVTAISPVFENPMTIPSPDISDSYLDFIETVDGAISGLDDHTQNRIQLSLRWFHSAQAHEGVDGLLRYWIALETLAMPDSTNIKPLETLIASASGLSIEEARDRFCVGRLFGLRSRIVHDGSMVPINASLLDYVAALYGDVLLASVGLDSGSRTEAMLKDFDVFGYLSSLLAE